MSKFHNTNVVFRCPAELKDRMRSFAESRDQELSTFIRSACVEVIRREMSNHRSNIPTEAEINKHLEELVG
jgi:hypothetical protein